MCTKKEVEDAVAAGVAPLITSMGYIETAISEMKETLKHPPCQYHGDKITRLEMEFSALKESSEKFEEEKNKEIYPRLRAVETDIATLTQQNKGQDEWSAKTWVIIMAVFTVALNTLSYYLR